MTAAPIAEVVDLLRALRLPHMRNREGAALGTS